MKNRNPLIVFLLPLLTFGFYGWYWFIKTKGEMNSKGEKIPTAWIWLIPLIGQFWWIWKYAEGVEHVSKNELNMFLALLALYLLGPIGMAIVQEAFNRSETPVVATTETAPTSSVYQPGTTVLPPMPPVPSSAPTQNPPPTETTTNPPTNT